MLDVNMFWLLLKDRGRAFLKESHIGCYDILNRIDFTSFWNMIWCLMSFLMEKPAKVFLELKTSFSMKDS